MSPSSSAQTEPMKLASEKAAAGMGLTKSRIVRALVLVVLAMQNCSLMMATSYSRSLPGPKYLMSAAILASEVLKTAVVLGVLLFQHGPVGAQVLIKRDVFGSGSQTARYAVPSIFYTLQNHLWYFAMSNLDSVSAAASSQTKIVSTAIFSMLILSRQLNRLHWSALGLLMAGLATMKVEPEMHKPSSSGTYYLGLLSMVAACTSSGYAGVYLEKLFKQLDTSVWTANLQLQLFCLPVACLALLANLQGLREGGLLRGWSGLACAVVLLNALGGFLVSLTMKYADNILKTFAVSISVVVNCLLSSAFMSVHLPGRAILGVAMVVTSTLMYSMASFAGKSHRPVAADYMPVDKAASDLECCSTDVDERSGEESQSCSGRSGEEAGALPEIVGTAEQGC